MQISQPHNICIRCGKPRIVTKTWKEKVGNLMTIFSLTACPDEECQAIVEHENAKQKAKRDQEKELREQRKQKQMQTNRKHLTLKKTANKR